MNRMYSRAMFTTGALAVLLLGVSATGSAKTEVVHLTYTSHNQASHDYLKRMAAEFEASHPDIDINLIIGRQDQMQVMVAAGTPPDVIDLPAVDMGTYIANDYFVDLRPLLKASGHERDFAPEILGGQKMPNGGIFMLPAWINVVLTWFNQDMFRAAGLPTPIELGDGWNWDNSLAFAKKLTVDKNGDGTPEQFGMDRSYAGFSWAVHQAGGQFYDDLVEPTKSLWNTPKVLEGIQYVNNIFEAGVTSRWHVDNWTDYYFWKNGTAIDIVDQPGIIGAFLNDVDFDWDMALQPKGPFSRATRVAVGGYMIPKATKHLKETWEWLEFLALNEDNARGFMEATGLIPALRSLQPEYKDVAGISDKNWGVLFENTQAPNSFPGYFVDKRLSPRTMLGSLYQVFMGKVAPKAWLEKTDTQATAIINELAQE